MLVFAIPVIIILVTLLLKIAVHPIRTLFLVLRVLFFIFAVGAWVMFFILRSELDRPVVFQDLLLPILFTIPWLLTFIPSRRQKQSQ